MGNVLKIIVAVGLLTLLIVAAGCSKKGDSPREGSGDHYLKIKLENNYIDGTQVDSAVAIWIHEGQARKVTLLKSVDTLIADIKEFTSGAGELEIQLFTSKKFGGSYSSRWLTNKTLTISHGSHLVFDGPSAFSDPDWKPRVELKDGVGHFTIVALRPEDPYFFIRDVPEDLSEIVLSRQYWRQGGGVNQVAGGEWSCTPACADGQHNIENNQFFDFLPMQIGQRTWNHIEIIVLYADFSGGGYVLSFTHTIDGK